MPLTVNISTPQTGEIIIEKGDTAEIVLDLRANKGNLSNIEMLSSGSFSPSGRIVNATGIFSEQTVSFPQGDSK